MGNSNPKPIKNMRPAVKKQTHLQQRMTTSQRCQKRIMRLLHWDEEQYCWYKYQHGLDYLHELHNGDQYIIAQMECSAIFWSWWKNQWTLREEVYLDEADMFERIHLDYRLASYDALNNVKELATDIHPNGVVMDESYDSMMQELMKTR